MSRANPLWGVPRILVRHPRPPSQTWRTFLENHIGSLVSVEFFVIPTGMFKVLFVFVVLAHERRRIVTSTPPTPYPCSGCAMVDRVGRHNRRDLPQDPSAESATLRRETSALVVGQPQAAAP
jgi:hypothetical protein